MTIIARRTFPTDDLPSFIDYVKANGSKLTYAHAGLGTASYLCGLLLLKAINANATAVPYKGTGPAMVDLLGAQVDFMCDQTTNTTGPINDKLVKVFALTAPRRLGTLPEVPTTAEAGLKDFELSIWHGYYAPKGTPKPVLDRLNAALRKALQSKAVTERFAQLGMTRAAEEDVTPDSLRKKLESEIARWEPVIRAAPQQGQ
jgi:tripartite-type tricarboxylate transporter receptor subunit TctC